MLYSLERKAASSNKCVCFCVWIPCGQAGMTQSDRCTRTTIPLPLNVSDQSIIPNSWEEGEFAALCRGRKTAKVFSQRLIETYIYLNSVTAVARMECKSPALLNLQRHNKRLRDASAMVKHFCLVQGSPILCLEIYLPVEFWSNTICNYEVLLKILIWGYSCVWSGLSTPGARL